MERIDSRTPDQIQQNLVSGVFEIGVEEDFELTGRISRNSQRSNSTYKSQSNVSRKGSKKRKAVRDEPQNYYYMPSDF